jgi:hypothetical protein
MMLVKDAAGNPNRLTIRNACQSDGYILPFASKCLFAIAAGQAQPGADF